MSQTANYNLHLTNNSSEKFLDWREKMNGLEDSNMVKIDFALSEKANNSVAIYATLLATAWTGDEAPYTQTLSVEGLSETQNGVINIAHDATADQREIARKAMLSVIGQEDGKLIIIADGEIPEFDIPVSIILLG